MSSGKKGKRTKLKTVPLNDFLAGSGNEIATSVTGRLPFNWADEVEDDHGSSYGYSSKPRGEPINLPTAPRATRDPDFSEENIPTKPPFTAHLVNLSFESTTDDLADFFRDLKIVNIQIPNGDNGRPKGFGYVEFEDRNSLIEALKMSNMSIKGRRVKIEVSNSANDDRRGRMNRDRGDDRFGDPDRTTGDWRSGPREELPYEGERYRPRGGYESRREDREKEGGGGGGGGDIRPGAWREGNDSGSRSSFRDRASDRDREWSRDRDRDRGSGFGPRRNYGDSDRDRNNVADSEPRTRPKLNLQPRTKPIEPIVVGEPDEDGDKKEEKKEEVPPPVKPKPTPVPSANIFGSAKPVDTAAREREIEERLSKVEMRPKEDTDSDSREKQAYRPPREGAWGRRNGENRDEKEPEKKKPETWRTDEDKSKSYDKPAARTPAFARGTDYRGDSKDAKGPPPAVRSSGPAPRTASRPSESRPSEKERKSSDEDDEVVKMPKAEDEEAPNFVASNKYSMLSDDVEPDNDVE